MRATITKDYLDHGDEVGRQFIYGASADDPIRASVETVRRMEAYDDDGIRYYELTCEFNDDTDLGDLLNMLGTYSGVTFLKDLTGDGDDWSAE